MCSDHARIQSTLEVKPRELLSTTTNVSHANPGLCYQTACCRQEVSKQTFTFRDLPLRSTVTFTTHFKTVTPEGHHHQMQMTRQQVPLSIAGVAAAGVRPGTSLSLLTAHVFTKEQFLPGVGHGQENGDLLLRWHLNFTCYRQEHHFVRF